MFTVQADRVLCTLARDGVYYVKKSYVQQKYQETAWIFREAYDFFTAHASEILSPLKLNPQYGFSAIPYGRCRIRALTACK